MCHKNVWYWIFYYMVLCWIFMLSICTVEFILIWFYTRYGILWHHFHKSQNRKETSQFVGVCCDVVLGNGHLGLPGLARRRNAQRSQEAVCFDVYPWMRRAMVGAISCCFRVEGGHVDVGNCCSIFLRRKFQQRYPKTVHVCFLVHYEST